MEHLQATRALMADSLAFHIIFVMFGVGLPIVFSSLEYLGIKNKKPKLIDSARLLSYVATILVVAGVVSGTIIAIQMSLMWPKLPEFASKMIGLPFMFEGYAFILEALFLGYYMYTWDKIKGYRHWVLSLPIILGALLSAFFITSVDSFMNNPKGFDYINGQIVNAHPWQGIFTPTTFYMFTHSVLGYLLAIFLVVAAGYGWYVTRKKPAVADANNAKYIIVRFMAVSFVLVLSIGLIGHFQTQYLAKTQPRKFAAIELIPVTTSNAPYIIGGELSEDGYNIKGGIKIPNLLSILAGNSPSTQVRGLHDYPKAQWPMLVVNKLFEFKMLFVGVLIAMPILFFVVYRFWPKKAFKNPMMLGLLIAAPLAFVVVELGWMVTEFGRQPYVINGYLLTADAFVSNPGILQWGYIFPTLYIVLFIVTVVAARKILKLYAPASKKGDK